MTSFCCCCGRKRGDGRRDRGWQYLCAELPGAKLVLRPALCPGCVVGLNALAVRKGAVG